MIAGGHTVINAEPKYGLCVTGCVDPARMFIKGALRPGDRLFLSKPLGTGVVTTAAKAGAASSAAIDAAV
jgi:selenide,water dikinase